MSTSADRRPMTGAGVSTEADAKTPSPSPLAPSRWTMTIPGWTPTLDNQLMRGHRKKAHRLKSKDVDVLARAALIYKVPPATTRRRVAVAIRNRYGSFPDDAAPLKSLLDALVRNGLLKDDSREWLEFSWPPTFERGPKGTVITLEDL